MKVVDGFKVLFYVFVLGGAILLLQLLQNFGTDGSIPGFSKDLVWEEEFSGVQLNDEYWVSEQRDSFTVRHGHFIIQKLAETLILDLDQVISKLPTQVDSGYLELKIKLPISKQVEFSYTTIDNDTTYLEIPEGVHSNFITLKSEGLSLKKLQKFQTAFKEEENGGFDIVNTTRKFLESDELIYDRIRIYEIKEDN